MRLPVVLAVGLGDEVADACRRSLDEEGIAFVRASQGVAACRAIFEVRPSIVAIGSSLWSDEIRAIATAAAQVGARVIEIPRLLSKLEVAPLLARAAAA